MRFLKKNKTLLLIGATVGGWLLRNIDENGLSGFSPGLGYLGGLSLSWGACGTFLLRSPRSITRLSFGWVPLSMWGAP